MIEFTNARPPASTDDLVAAEQRLAELGHHIPPSYEAFLAQQDGGRPTKHIFTFEQHDREHSSRVRELLGAGDVVRTAERVGDIPPGVLPIGYDDCGNYICLDARDGRDGPVLFWDHEEGFDDVEVDYSNLYEIAPDLQTFLDDLIEDPDPPRPYPRSRWKRLLGR